MTEISHPPQPPAGAPAGDGGAPAAEHLRAAGPSPATARLRALDKRHIWHPFTRMAAWLEDDPLVIDSAEGCWLTDTDGNRYLDGNASLWVNVHGHRHPALDAALADQLGRVAHTTFLGLSNPPAIELAARLAELAPGRLERVFYSESGASAVEVAIKMAFAYHRHRGEPERTLFVSVDGAYHGDTVGSVSVGHIEAFHDTYRPLLFTTETIPQPSCYRCPLGLEHPACDLACADVLDDVLARNAGRVAAVVVEPRVQGAAGIITAPDGHLARVAEIARRHGVLVIADEVATGFGRTGPLFSCEAEGVEPDLMAVGKGLTGGYLPMSATLTTPEVFDAFLSQGHTFFHGHSYTGNPLAAAVALANLDLFAEALPAAQELAGHLRAGLAAVRALDHVGDVRQRGLMVGIELVADRSSRTPYPAGLRVGEAVCRRARDLGVVVRPLGDVVVLMPALTMSTDDVALLCATVGAAITDVTGGGALPGGGPPPGAGELG